MTVQIECCRAQNVFDLQTTKDELVQKLRKQGKGCHQNSSKFRGVTRHQKGKWEARIGQVHPCVGLHC